MTYYVKKATNGFVELRHSRYKEKFDQGNEHPHDLCATAHTVQELREMVEKYNLGHVDWGSAKGLEDKPEPGDLDVSVSYYVRMGDLGMIELRQARYKEQLERGDEHPHDLCAVAHTVQELRKMVDKHKLGDVDWASTESLVDKQEAEEPAPFRP